MYAIVTADRLELPLMVTDSKKELASWLGISKHGVDTALRRGKNPKYQPRHYRLIRINDVDDDCKTTLKNAIEQAERVFDGTDERFERRHR